MALTPRLELRQSQALVMTPQLQQAIKLLQLSNMELVAYVEEELAQNPLLERDDGAAQGGDELGVDGTTVEDPAEGAADETLDGAVQEASEAALSDFGDAADGDALETMDLGDAEGVSETATRELDVDYDNVWNNDSIADASLSDTAFATWAGGQGGSFDPMESDLEQILSGQETLTDRLVKQLNEELADPADRVIGLHLINRLDDAGYISDDLADIADLLGCEETRVEKTLSRMQDFDPPGIFARSLAECLALQLRERNRLDPAMEALLENLDLLAKRDLSALIRICGVDQEDLIDMVAEIRALDPKPALAFDNAVAQPITPDVIMRPHPGGGWTVDLNSDSLPRLLVNNRYHARVSQEARSKKDRTYIDDCFQSANWLVKALHQRATTILKVATEIVRQQDGFFVHGIQALKPLVLRDIAEAIDMHESTVSRVTSNKYIASPRGIYELKYFFTPAIASSAGGDAYSAESVRHKIKALIDEEKPDSVLSDDKIVEILTGEGVDIARRTVAKYREALGIPSSVQRRRQKKSGI
ncbi:MAG: RNA polymerase factor sigma-54 [Rhodospirillales bacterium]|nr:RNA polymerase factor sigma-54 [Rhodospirillales bacterium]